MTVTLTQSALLRHKISLVSPLMAQARASFMTHPRVADVLPEFWFTTHCMIRASVPLMQAALERCRRAASRDPVAARLADYFPDHIVEELEHDEWLLDDLAVLGYDRDALLRRLPPATVAAMVGSQYYWIFHYHPVALLGYITVMEGYPPSMEQVEFLVARTGFPREAFRTMIAHAEFDGDHNHALDELIDELPLTPEQVSLLGVSALETVQFGCQAVLDAVERHGRRAAG